MRLDMLLYVFRHGEADWPQKGKAHEGEERHLTPDGRKWVGRVVSIAEKELGFQPELILSSPLARATETAEIARATLTKKPEVVIDESLEAERPVKDVYQAIRKRKGVESVALVSHLPLVNHLFADLLGADSNIGLYSGAIACIKCKTNPGHGKGMLLWMLPPRQWFHGKEWR